MMEKQKKKRRAMSWLVVIILLLGFIVPAFASVAAAETPEDLKAVVSYDANGGSGEMEPGTVEILDYVTLPENDFSAPEGKVFKAWDIGGTEYAPDAEVQISSNTVVKAVWVDAAEANGDLNASADAKLDDQISENLEEMNNVVPWDFFR